MCAEISIISNFLLGAILFILRASFASASSVTLSPRASNLPDPDSLPLVFDTSEILAPTNTPSKHPDDSPQVTPVYTATPNLSKPEGWTPRYTLIVAIVVCSSLVTIVGLFVVFYIARRNEQRRLEEVAARNEKTAIVAKATGSVKYMRSLRPMVTASTGTVAKTKALPKEAAGAASTVSPSVSRTVRNVSATAAGEMKGSIAGAIRNNLGKPNVAGTLSRASNTVRATRPPRLEHSLSRTVIAEKQVTWNSTISAAALKESEEKQVVFGPTVLKESEEKEVVVVLAPGVPSPAEEEQTQWTGTWNRNAGMSVPGRALSKSEYMV